MATFSVRSAKGTVARINSPAKTTFKVTSTARGPRGPAGPAGPASTAPSTVPGPPGPDAYQTWLNKGNTGDYATYQASLKGGKGDTGNAGPGVPIGGSPGQIVGKASANDFDTAWVDPPNSAGDYTDLLYEYQRGVSFSGMEFAKDQLPGIPGTNYTVHRAEDFAYAASLGLTVVRLAILWERLQPVLSGPLDPTYKQYIDQCIQFAKNNGMKIILEFHNYGRRDVNGTEHVIGDGVLTVAHFANVWGKVALAYKNENGIFMYDLMNEPHDMPIPMSAATYLPGNTVLQFITNTSVEDNTTGFQFDGSAGEFTQSSEYAYVGTKSIKQLSTGGYNSITTPAGFNLQPFTNYVFSFYHRTTADFDYQTPFVEIATGDPYANGGTILASGQTTEVGTTFKRFVLPFNTGNNSKVFIRIHTNGVPVTAYYDAFNLTQGTSAVPYTAASGNGTVATVTEMNQAAINAIRSVDLNKWIALEFDRYSGLQSFTTMFGTANPTKWWTDPANKTMISFHYYFDSNQEGTYLQPWDVAYRNRIAAQVAPALDWAQANGVKVYIGEYGVINGTSSDAVNWQQDMGTFLSILDDHKAYATHWAMGSWYGSITTLQPAGAFYAEKDFSVQREQAPVVAAHPSKKIGGGDGGAGVWGEITGTLADQTDLKTALDAKANTSSLGSLAVKNAASLTADVSGVLPAANGGTGISNFTFTSGQILAATSATSIGSLATTGSGAVVRANSPALSGTPTAPTAAQGTNTTQVASTAHVKAGLDTKQDAGDYATNSSVNTGLAGKVSQSTSTNLAEVYTRLNGVEGATLFSSSAGNNTIARRTSNGELAVATATANANAVNKGQFDTALAGKSDTTHTHAAADITSGVIAPARLGTGTADATTVLYGDGTFKTAPSGGGTASPLTTKGDLYGFSTTNARLPIGANDYVLTADSTAAMGLAWKAAAALTNPMTSVGDMIIGGTSGASTRLPVSTTANRILRIGTASTAPTWSQVALGTDVTGTLSVTLGGSGRTGNTAYSLISGGANTAQQVSIATGTAGQFLRSGGSSAVSAFSTLTRADVSDNATNNMGVVVHGTTASTARPTGYAQITWIGTVAPTNATTNDIWYNG